jgi:acyl dehydratase
MGQENREALEGYLRTRRLGRCSKRSLGIANMNKKEFSFENIEMGKDLGRKEILITDEMIQKYTHAIETDHPWYLNDSPFGGRIAPPTIFDNETLRLLDSKYARFGSIHAKQAWEFKYPVFLGKRYVVAARVVDKYVKRERGYIVMEMRVISEDGTEVCCGQHTSIVSLKRRV